MNINPFFIIERNLSDTIYVLNLNIFEEKLKTQYTICTILENFNTYFWKIIF